MLIVNFSLIFFTREALHMLLLRDIFLLTRSPPPLKRNPLFLVSCPFSSHETTRRAFLASNLQAQTYTHALAKYVFHLKSQDYLFLPSPSFSIS